MRNNVTVIVPATSANCGAGFDTLGLACNLYNEFTFELLDDYKLELEVIGEGSKKLFASEKNLAFLAFFKVWDKFYSKRKGLKIVMKNIIPLSRGLGSSSSAIVAGLIAANILSDNRLNNNDILNLANEIEGHPDNVAPAIFGGITISYVKDDVAFCKKFLPAKKLRFIAVVPDEPLSTHKARAAIPKIIPHSDAVYNASRTALYVAALLTGDYSKLHDALDDKLHQPYRLPLIRGANDVLKAATTNGAYGAIISGAGSTLMAYADENSDCHKIGKAMVEAFSNNGQHSVYHILELDDLGAREKI